MAVVFLARDARHDHRVALKVLRPELAASIGADRFLREIQIQASLQHPHVLPIRLAERPSDTGVSGSSAQTSHFQRGQSQWMIQQSVR
jgi:serine/threonine protein kinase